MNGALDAQSYRGRPFAGTLLVAGTVLASLTEALASTIPTLARDDIIGSTHATPDEFAWLDFGYVTLKLLGFLLAPWLLMRIGTRMLVIIATLAMGLASCIAICTVQLELLVSVRVIQGLSGGVLLVAGQTALFLAFPKKHQPIVQAVFAMGAIVAPATAALALEGWLLDFLSWAWIFFSIVPLSLAAAGILLLADDPPVSLAPVRPFDWVRAMLISVALVCVCYVLSRGSRWDWLEQPHILWLTVLGGASFLFALGRHAFENGRRLFDAAPFRVEGFSFAFAVSFVAGAALSGSAFLIPLFSRSSLALTYLETGQLLLPSGVFFSASLLLTAYLIQARRVPPIFTIPVGILLIMTAMWMLSGATSESGPGDMMMPILVRGVGFGFVFLSITLTAFMGLERRDLATGIGLFNVGRQLGGLIGVAVLATLIDHQVARNVTVLGASVVAGEPAVSERMTTFSAVLAEHGISPATTASLATRLLDRSLIDQSNVIAFNTGFNCVALLFVFAAPLMVALKIVLHMLARRAQLPRPSGGVGGQS